MLSNYKKRITRIYTPPPGAGIHHIREEGEIRERKIEAKIKKISEATNMISQAAMRITA